MEKKNKELSGSFIKFLKRDDNGSFGEKDNSIKVKDRWRLSMDLRQCSRMQNHCGY
jgi:hypothetical protein